MERIESWVGGEVGGWGMEAGWEAVSITQEKDSKEVRM